MLEDGRKQSQVEATPASGMTGLELGGPGKGLGSSTAEAQRKRSVKRDDGSADLWRHAR